MIDYRKIWQSVNEDSKKNPQRPFIARMIPSKSVFAVFLATDAIQNIRYLYIQLNVDHRLNIEELPRFVGLEIEKVNTTLGNIKNQNFLRFRQLIPNTENIFELVISDICNGVIAIEDSGNLEKVLKITLSGWKVFFEKKSTRSLTIQQQKGLFAELYFMKVYLFVRFGHLESIQYWTAADKTNHDFQLRSSAVEVKSTSGKQHRKFTVSSEKQLDNSGLEILVLALFSLNLHVARPDISLSALVQEITDLIKDDSVAYFLFDLKLIKAGYNKDHAGRYRIGFTVSETAFFEVRDSFPKLLSADLPPGIGDIKYSVMASACEAFRTNQTILNTI